MKESDYDQLRVLIGDYKKYQNGKNNELMHDRNCSKILTILDPDIQSMLQTYKSQYSPDEYDDIVAVANQTLFRILPEIDLIEHSSPLPYIKKAIINAVNSSLKIIKQNNYKSWPVGQWDTTNENVQKNSTVESAETELMFESFISYIEKKGFDSNEIQLIKLYFTHDFQFQRTQLEISKMVDLSEPKVQRILKKAEEYLKTYLQKQEIVRKQNSATKKRKKAGANKKKSAPVKNVCDISTAFNDFDPGSYHVVVSHSQNHFVFQVEAKINISFSSDDEIIMKIDPDSTPSDITISDVQTQIKYFENLTIDDLKFDKRVIRDSNIFFTPNFEAFVRHYAPIKTEKEMRAFLKSIGCYEKYRKYITRYKDNFLPEISPTK